MHFAVAMWFGNAFPLVVSMHAVVTCYVNLSINSHLILMQASAVGEFVILITHAVFNSWVQDIKIIHEKSTHSGVDFAKTSKINDWQCT
jgi:hypothetical protein